jgi:hypothetical protein
MEPVLAKIENVGDIRRFTVHGGLHDIKGNRAPHFSLTADIRYNDGGESGGCCHDEILKHWPQFTDLAALHMSDIDGVPMYAVENGWYYASGATRLQHYQQQYYFQVGHPYRDDADAALKVLRNHLRIDDDAARALCKALDLVYTTEGAKAAKAMFAEYVEQQKPRWKAEAEACIAKHALRIFK